MIAVGWAEKGGGAGFRMFVKIVEMKRLGNMDLTQQSYGGQ
jgi:hypothetical protein